MRQPFLVNRRNFVSNTLRSLASGAILCGTLQVAQAAPSGLTLLPSTDIYAGGTMHLDLDTQGTALTANRDVRIGLEFGIGPDNDRPFGRTELGVDYQLVSRKAAQTGQLVINGVDVPRNLELGSSLRNLLFNLKTQLYNNQKSQTRIVAGVHALGLAPRPDTTRRTSAIPIGGINVLADTLFPTTNFRGNIIYVVGSRQFDFGRVHLGAAYSLASDEELRLLSATQFRLRPTGNPNTFNAVPIGGNTDRLFVQLAYEKDLSDDLRVTADYYSGSSYFSRHSLSMSYSLDDRSVVQIGVLRQNNSNISPRTLTYVGFDYNFGRSGSGAAPGPDTETSAPEVPR